jgi:hypothetical protein
MINGFVCFDCSRKNRVTNSVHTPGMTSERGDSHNEAAATFPFTLCLLVAVCFTGSTSLSQQLLVVPPADGLPPLPDLDPGVSLQPISVFSTAVPNNSVENDQSAITLGVKFWSGSAGSISAISFYRGATSSIWVCRNPLFGDRSCTSFRLHATRNRSDARMAGIHANRLTQLPISKLQPTQSLCRGRCCTRHCSHDGNSGLERWNRLHGVPSFGPPYANDQGVFAISGNKAIINPSVPGLTGLANTTQNITVQASAGIN